MWEGGIPAAKVKRGITNILSRSYAQQATASSAWDSQSGTQPTPAVNPPTSAPENDCASSEDVLMLQALRKSLSDFDQLCVVDAIELSDPRVAALRNSVEQAMPRLCAISEDQSTAALVVEARMVKNLAKVMLQKFSDVNQAALEGSKDVSQTRSPRLSTSVESSSETFHNSPSNILPPAATNSSSASAKSSRESTAPAIDPGARRVHGDMDASATDTSSEAQQVMLTAVHNLLSTTLDKRLFSSPKSLWCEAPAAKSPDELLALQSSSSHVRADQSISRLELAMGTNVFRGKLRSNDSLQRRQAN